MTRCSGMSPTWSQIVDGTGAAQNVQVQWTSLQPSVASVAAGNVTLRTARLEAFALAARDEVLLVVDAENDQRWRRAQPAREQHLLDVAAGEAAEGRALRRRADVVFFDARARPLRATQAPPGGAVVAWLNASGRSTMTGRRTTNSAPLPRPSLWASIVPPCRWTSARVIARPSPSPPNCRLTAPSPCSNGGRR